jgi:hypothetical protein
MEVVLLWFGRQAPAGLAIERNGGFGRGALAADDHVAPISVASEASPPFLSRERSEPPGQGQISP